MTLIQKPFRENCPLDTGAFLKDGHPQSITIHWIGAFPGQTPDIVRNWWLESGHMSSAHFIIKDDICMQCWPIHKVAYHAGTPAGNNTSIGIEVIPATFEGEFSKASIKTLRELLFLFPKMPIYRHYDWTGKDCPKFYINEERWQKLLLEITPESW